MHARVSVNLISARAWTLEQDIAFLESAGIETISLTTSQLGPAPQAAIDAIRQGGFRVVSIGTGGSSMIESAEATLGHLRPVIDAATALGCPTVFTVTGPAPQRTPTREACDRLVACLGPARDYAAGLGVELAIEHSSPAMRWLGFVSSLGDAIEVAREAEVGVVLEVQNCWYERDLDRIFREHAHRFSIVQCSDFLVGEQPVSNRRVPGDGSMPLEWMIGQLLEAGYAGYFDLELIGPAIDAEGYDTAIRRGVDWLSERLTAWGMPG